MSDTSLRCVSVLVLSLLVVRCPGQADARVTPLDGKGFAAIAADFGRRNPGYALSYQSALRELGRAEKARVVFVQGTADSTKTQLEAAGKTSEASCGDIVVLRAGETLSCRPPISALLFEVPGTPPVKLPWIIRPDWDPKITDTPGGCATETGAYRRILLTWEQRNGPYVWHEINAHRVRIHDSFSHYHPLDGGFDEFYLVQGANEGARILTSSKTDAILDPGSIKADEAKGLLRSHPLKTGDLVYLPRGVMHRGLGGVLAQVITIPGFRPGAEIPLDDQLEAINRRLGLEAQEALPTHTKRRPFVSTTRLTAKSEGKRLDLFVDGKPFTSLHHEGLPLPVLHPLLAADGTPLTRGYPLNPGPLDSRDHPHHRGLWFAHGNVNGSDFWHDRSKKAGRVVASKAPELQKDGTLLLRNRWIDAKGVELLDERRELRCGLLDHRRAIDFRIELRALVPELRFGDTKEGSFALRLAPELRVKGKSAQGSLRNSEGRKNGKVWGKRARWVNATGKVGGASHGVTVFDHPKNHAHPTWWHARTYGLLAANPFGVHDFEKKPKGSGDLVLKEGEVLKLRYLVVLHDEETTPELLDLLGRRFAVSR